MISPVAEVRAFLRAALVEPVPRDHTETDAAFRRRRVVAAVTLVVGLGRARPGAAHPRRATRSSTPPRSASPRVWAIGALRPARSTSVGPTPVGRARPGRSCSPSRSARCCSRIFLVGGLVVARIPVLREPVDQPARPRPPRLAARRAPLITAVNGIAEELYFRGALYAAVGRRHAVAVTTVVYALTTVGSRHTAARPRGRPARPGHRRCSAASPAASSGRSSRT